MKTVLKVLGVCLALFVAYVCIDHYFQMKEWQRVVDEGKKRLAHECLMAEIENTSTVRFKQDGKSSPFLTGFDMSRPIFLYDIEQNILMGVILGNKLNFIAERKALPAHP